MGAGQSSDNSAAHGDSQVSTSYYDLLGVQRQATEDEIKKAYRRKALELHPDRNFGNEEQATKTFAEIQAAYEILSDPQERAWYDSHETAILNGDNGDGVDAGHSYANIKITTADDLARVVRKFNSNVEFSDSPSGFFGFLREQFEHLAKEEEAAAAWDNTDVREYPPFGHQKDSHDDVVKEFYSAWTNFSTVKSFAWKDKYRLSEAPDRRVRRLMEKENDLLRQEAIREFNEAVRSFVLFVRKRDPRYQPSTQSEAERQRVLRDAAEAQRARARAANLAKAEGVVPEWAQVREEDELEQSSEEDVEEEVVECVACDKIFKSERQYEAHERSKKHQKAVQALQRKMQKENEHLHLNAEMTASKASVEDWDVIGDEDVETLDSIPVSDADDEHIIGNGVTHEPLDEKQEEIEPCTDAPQESQLRNEDDDLNDSDDSDSQDSLAEAIASTKLDDASDRETTENEPVKKKGKAAQKRAKRAAAAAASTPTDNNHKCATCDAAFPSRTQLFQHIKKHGHAALKTATKNKKGKK